MPGPFANFGANVNSILAGLAPMNYAGGLISPDEAQAAQRQAQLTQGATMLQAAGPSPMPVSFGQGFGTALMRAQAAQNGAIDDSLKRKLVASEIMQRMQPQRPAQDPLVQVIGQDGRMTLVPQSKAAGMTPASAGMNEYQRQELALRQQEVANNANKDQSKPQLITRPAPDAGEGMVQDWTVDLKSRQLQPVGDPYPAAGTSAAQMGSREGVMFSRVASSANEAVAALRNISELPIGASTGMLGIGASPGASAIASSYGALKNAIAPQAVQDYNTMLAGVSRSLATIETAGLAPNGSLSHSMDSIQLREGDTELTKLRKLAEMRQILEKGIEPNLANPRIPPEQKKLISDIITQAESAIPYTQHDITELQRRQQKEPALTLQDLISQKGLRSGAVATVKSDDDYAALPSGTVFTGPDGKQRRKP